jgi:hypothetical protein
MTTTTKANNNGSEEVPKGWEHRQSVQVYIKPTKTATSKYNDDIKKPPKNSPQKCYWLGEYHAQSPSEIWYVQDVAVVFTRAGRVCDARLVRFR